MKSKRRSAKMNELTYPDELCARCNRALDQNRNHRQATALLLYQGRELRRIAVEAGIQSARAYSVLHAVSLLRLSQSASLLERAEEALAMWPFLWGEAYTENSKKLFHREDRHAAKAA